MLTTALQVMIRNASVVTGGLTESNTRFCQQRHAPFDAIHAVMMRKMNVNVHDYEYDGKMCKMLC